ncbi:MAG: hypothetical protein LBL83_03920 [Clostridiales bacterium]|jgi:putative aldouronate transport system substrate-binding protein|nr:hypothetical protein [Clostridiales bacterium]
MRPAFFDGKQPVMRKQAYTAGIGRAFVIFKNNPDYAATLRLAEYVATPEGTMHVNTGKQGVVWDYNDEGKAYCIFSEESPDLMSAHAGDLGLHNSFASLRDESFYESFFYEQTVETERSRAWAFYEVYEPFVPQGDVVYVSAVLDVEDEEELQLFQTDLNEFRKTTFANWITGKGDIDAEWERYVAGMESRNLAKWLEYKQQAYDLMLK